MNFEFNKIAGAVLGTALGVMVVGIVADEIYAPHVPEQPGFIIAVAEPGEGGGEAPEAPQVEPIADRLQVASAEDGAGDVAKCKTCHTFEQGGANKVGPNLWNVVGQNVIHGDFAYSDAMRAAGEAGMEWTFENLDHFIENPKKFIPGTAMSFAGVKDPGQRADIIAYLRTLSDNPVPLPPPTPAPTAEAPPPGGEIPPSAAENPPAATETQLVDPEPATPPATEEPAPAPEPATPPAATEPEPAAPPATEAPAPAPEPAPPATEIPAPAPEPMTPPETEAPAPAPETAPPATETPAPAPEPTMAPTPDAEADSPEGAPAPATKAPASEPTMAPTPDAEADSPEGAPASETPAQ